MTFDKTSSTLRAALGATALTLIASVASADQVILDDLIVDGSLCVGFDCVNGESFGFDTIRLKENNVRIKFDDTSNSASFPNRDWQLTANDTSNGGQNKFSIDDITGGRTPFTIEGNAPSHSLYVDDGGRIGLGTATPVVELHVVDGDSPTIRLEQDGSSGFTPQTWDVAGNEANFFVRDATNGSTLPFKIRPGAPNNALVIEPTTGDVGMGAGTNPSAPLHVVRTNGTAKIRVQDTGGTGASDLLLLENDGNPQIVLKNTNNGSEWEWGAGQNFVIEERSGALGVIFTLTPAGNLILAGTLTTGSATVYPDYVFQAGYDLMPLAEVEKFITDNGHLPKIPTAAEVAETGLNISEMQVALLEKVEELTLYTLEQQRTIDALQLRVDTLAD